MKITMYELLGMIKDGKVPKKIRFLNHYYMWKEKDEDYQKEDGLMLFGNIKINYILNSEVEILEEEKKIPEKLPIGLKQTKDGIFNTIVKDDIQYELNEKEEMICKKIHEIIDYLDYLKSKGDE